MRLKIKSLFIVLHTMIVAFTLNTSKTFADKCNTLCLWNFSFSFQA